MEICMKENFKMVWDGVKDIGNKKHKMESHFIGDNINKIKRMERDILNFKMEQNI